MDDPVTCLLALLAAHGPRVELVRALHERPPEVLAREPALRPSTVDFLRARRQRRSLELLGILALLPAQLPATLRRATPPVASLFVRGDPLLLEAPAVAVVGARDASPGPRAWAAAVARAAVAAGLVVVSGGARGIDAAAHRATLGAGGRTVAYLGVAADRIYPRCNRRLFEQLLVAGGVLASEHPPLSETYGPSHAMRNRLIAASARVVFVAEAREASGSLGTALAARRLGVPVIVPPPSVGGERAGLEPLVASGGARVAGPDELARILASALAVSPIAPGAPEALQGRLPGLGG
jgi:DNA processing protein